MTCPNCGSDRIRRGGTRIWGVYGLLIALAIPAVFLLKLNAALVGGVMIAGVILANLIFDQRVCLECGNQWRPEG